MLGALAISQMQQLDIAINNRYECCFSMCLVVVERLFLAMPRGCLWFVIVVFPDHTHILFTDVHPNYILFKCQQTTKATFSIV